MKVNAFAVLTSKLRNLSVLFKQRALQLWAALRANPYFVLLLVAISIYGLVFSYFTVLKHNVFLSSGWDLGVFDQALYTTLHNGKFLYYTADLFLNPSGSYFAQHISPILFLVLPFYAINSSSITLLVLKSFVLAFGALPLYLLGRELLESAKAGFIVALVYLLYVPLQGANWFDFQPQIFLPVLFFSMFYFAVKSKWKLYFLTTALAAMVEEHISLLIFLVAVYLLITSKVRPFWQSLKSFRSMNRNLASVITMAFSILYFFVAGWIKNSFPIDPKLMYIYKALPAFSVLGVNADPITFPLYALFNPQRAFAALLYDFPLKFLFLVLLFAPLLFFSLKSKVVLITVPFLGLFLLSNYGAYYSVGAHYPLYILAFIFVAALMVLKRLQHAARISILTTMLITSMLFTVSLSPLSPMSAPFYKEGLLWYSSAGLESNEQTDSLAKLVNAIPPNASVLTQNTIFPHVSNRLNAYIIPLSYVTNDTKYLRSLINSSDYVLLDLTWVTDDVNTVFVLDEIASNGSYGAYALGRNAVLFKRGFQGDPLFAYYSTYRVLSAYSDLVTTSFAKKIPDPAAVSAKVVQCPANFDGCFVYGPSNYLLPGSYEVTFTVKAFGQSSSHVGQCEVTSNSGNSTISKRDIFGFELQQNKWTNFTLAFTSTKVLTNTEYRVSSYGTANMYVDRVIVKRISPNATSDFGMQTFGAGDLPLASGHMTNDGFLVFPQNTTSSTFWYGPYVNFTAGKYRATVMLNVSQLPQNSSEQVLTLTVSSFGRIYAKTLVRASDFVNKGQTSGWQNFTLEFIAREPLANVEFTGLNPSSNFTISLAYILIEKLALSPDINYELFSLQNGLQVNAGHVVRDNSSHSGEVAFSRKGVTEDAGIVVFGPFITLPSGNFTVIFRVRTNATSQDASLLFEVVSQPDAHLLSRAELTAAKITDGQWFNVTVPLHLENVTSNIEFRVSSNAWTDLYFDTITVQFPWP